MFCPAALISSIWLAFGAMSWLQAQKKACVFVHVWAFKADVKAFIQQAHPPSFILHNFHMSVTAEFSSILLTVDCKCPNLGRQPLLIMRITLLSNRKIKLNNTIAYSWSQTAAPKNTSVSTEAAPRSSQRTHIYPQAAVCRQYTSANLLLTCVTALAPHLVWSQSEQLEKASSFLWHLTGLKGGVWNQTFLWGLLWHIRPLRVVEMVSISLRWSRIKWAAWAL